MGATKVVASRNTYPQRPSAFNFGPGAVVVGQGIYEQSATKKARIGERLQVGDRVFRYAYNGAAALNPGKIVQQAALGGADTTLQTTRPVAVAAVVGDTRIYTTALTTAQAADVFADGWVSIFDASMTLGAYLYRIKGNSALATSGVASYLTLYDGLHVALTTSDQLEIVANPYNGVIINSSATTLTGPIVGVAPIYVDINYYFWCQTFGPCAVVSDAALDFDEYVAVSDSTVGLVEKDSATANTVVLGQPLAAGTASESSIMFLQILP
jgi:hypothetical protein